MGLGAIPEGGLCLMSLPISVGAGLESALSRIGVWKICSIKPTKLANSAARLCPDHHAGLG